MRAMGKMTPEENHLNRFHERIKELDRIVHERIGVANTLTELIYRYEEELGPASHDYEWSKDLVYYRAGYLRAVHYVVDFLQEVNKRQAHELYEFLIWEHDDLWKGEN